MGFNSGFKELRILKQSTPSWRFYSSYYNGVRNHEPEKTGKTFAIKKEVAGNAFCFRVFQFHLLSSFSRFFFSAIGILLELLQNLYTMIVPMSLNVAMK